jgi:hypothetical protein
MAAITGTAIAAGAAAYSVSQSVKAAKEKKAAADALNKSVAPGLSNSGDALSVSTVGADSQKAEQGRLASGQVQAASDSGSRGVIGSVGNIAAQNQKTNAAIAADLDQQQKDIDLYKAGDKQNIRALEEQRFKDKLAALSSQYNAAAQNQSTAMGNALSATGSAVNNYSMNKYYKDQSKPTITTASV